MLTIIFNWIYIIFTTFCLGFAFGRFSEKVLRYRIKSVTGILMGGLIVATVYSQIFSLFYRVNVEANVVLLLVCMAICFVMRRQMCAFVKEVWKESSIAGKVLVPVLFLIWAFFTSRGYMVTDMNLYHGQSIRWIEEYGVVKGLGNLHTRFGYNSSIFAVSALYSMKFLLGRSLHTVNGFIAFLMSTEVLKLGKVVRRKKMLLSDYARVGLFYYITITWDEIIAPSSDYAVMFTIFFIVIKWLSCLEEEDAERRNNIAPYALLCVAGAYSLSLKVTAGLILILIIKPAYMLLKEKRWKEIGIYLSLGLACALPWLIRNVIITGWLLYPFPALDLFDVDWKIKDVSTIIVDAELIKVYAKGLQDVGINVPLTEWFPNWFSTQLYSLEKVLIAAAMAAAVLTVCVAVWVCVRKQWEKADVLLVMFTVLGCYLFWQFSAPLMRYGYAHVLLLNMLLYGFLLESAGRFKVARFAYVGIGLFMVYKLYVGVDYIYGCYKLPNYLWQETYGTFEAESYEINGETVYFSLESGCCGYDIFPNAPSKEENIELRGDGFKDGFRCIGY